MRSECVQIRQSFLCRQMSKNCFILSIIRPCFQLFVCFPNFRHLPWNLLCLIYYWQKQEIRILLFSHKQLSHCSHELQGFKCIFEEHVQGRFPALMGKHLSLCSSACRKWSYNLVFSNCFSEHNINILYRVSFAEVEEQRAPWHFRVPREGMKLEWGTAERYNLVAKVVKYWLVEPDFIPLSSLHCLKVAE